MTARYTSITDLLPDGLLGCREELEEAGEGAAVDDNLQVVRL